MSDNTANELGVSKPPCTASTRLDAWFVQCIHLLWQGEMDPEFFEQCLEVRDVLKEQQLLLNRRAGIGEGRRSERDS